MTRLRDLDATFVRHTEGNDFREVDSIAEANGLLFNCPLCGRHSVLCWNLMIPQSVSPHGGRWAMTGTSLDNVTLSPSVNLNTRPDAACKWHGWVKNGDAT